jgi:hypothetical protein
VYETGQKLQQIKRFNTEERDRNPNKRIHIFRIDHKAVVTLCGGMISDEDDW